VDRNSCFILPKGDKETRQWPFREQRRQGTVKVKMQRKKWSRGFLGWAIVVGLLISTTGRAQQSKPGLSKVPARPARDWVRDGVIYEVYPAGFFC